MNSKLDRQLAELLDADIINSDTAQKITAFYNTKEQSKPNRLFTIFGVLGALLSGLGIILIIAHNWDDMPRNIITNPPFKYATDFMKLGYNLTAQSGGKLALFLRLNFLEGQKRYHWYKENKPSNIYVFSKRQTLWRNGEEIPKGRSGTTAYAWFVWRGKSWDNNETTLDWIEP